MSENKSKTTVFDYIFVIIFLLAILLAVNVFVFDVFGSIKNDEGKLVKVDPVGDTVVLYYGNSRETYSIDGIDNSTFNYNGKVHTFYSDDYLVREDGTPYSIVNGAGERVGTVMLRRDNNEESLYEIDLADLGDSFYSIPNYYDRVRVYNSGPDALHPASIRIEDRYTPIEVIFDNVKLYAPDVSPVLYSLSSAPVNLKIIGSVTLCGGNNPYTMEHISTTENFFSTVNTAANAYYVCMLSAIGTSASIIYGVDYYMDMFEGVTAMQLNVMENAWGKVEDLFNGKDGYPGLDGVAAVQVAGELNIVGDQSATLSITGGRGGDGGKGSSAFMTTTRGGDGGDGASAIVCGTLASSLGDRLTLQSGEGGFGGEGGSSVTGKGSRGSRGGRQEPKIVLDEEILTMEVQKDT